MSIPMEMSGSEMVDQPVLQPDLGGQAVHNERPQRQQARHPDRHLGEIEPEEIKLFDVLGAGQYGTVRKGIVREQEVAVKIFHRQDLNNKDILDFKMEVEAFFNVGGHPNLLMCMGACLRPGKLAIIMELLPKNKTLEDILSSPDLPLPLTTRLIWALEIAKGMLWIHTAQPNMVIHKDLKPANICIDSHQHVKVFDLGLSSIKPNDSTLVAGRHANGSPLWMAPESLLKKPFDEKVDVYSFAICLWQIITRKQPFASHNDLPRFIKAICINQERPPIREEWGQRICNLLKLSWHPIPRFRPDFNQIITQLNSLIIETSINDKDGQQLWASKWIDKQVIAWSDFFTWFAQKTGFSIPFNLENCKRYRCLKKLLVAPHPDYSGPGAPEVVSVQRFGYFLDCFGPLFDRTMVPVSSSSSSSSSAMVDLGSSSNAEYQEVVRSNCVHRMIKACHQPWFCGFLTREEVEQKLSDYVSGSFLVRISDRSDRFDQPNRAFFVISSIRDNRFFHHRVNFRADIGFSTQVSNAAHNETRTIISNFPDQSLRAFILQVFYDLNLTYGVTDGTFLDISNKNVPKDSGYTDAMISAMSDEVDDDDDVSDAEAQAELAYIGDSNE